MPFGHCSNAYSARSRERARRTEVLRRRAPGPVHRADLSFLRSLVPGLAVARSKRLGPCSHLISHQKGMKNVRHCSLGIGSPEPALAAVDRYAARDHPNHLATGNKVNSALDNPTSFFTAQSLNNRASDINNLLDPIGNGVQVLQAANTGITSLQSLVSNAQSIANQVLPGPHRLFDEIQCDRHRHYRRHWANNCWGTGG